MSKWKSPPLCFSMGIMAKAMAQPEGITRSIALAALAEAVPPEKASEALQEFIKGRTPEEETHSGTFESALFNIGDFHLLINC